MKNSSRFDGCDGGELHALEQRRARIGGLLEDALIECEPRQLAIDEQRARQPRVVMASFRAGCDDQLAAERFDEHVGSCRRGEPLHRQIARALELEDPRFVAADDPKVANFLQCARRQARWRLRRIAASLLTSEPVFPVERDVRHVAAAAAVPRR